MRDLKDRNDKKMTDVYLVLKLGEEFSCVPRVYQRTSGYVHLSATHLLSTMALADGSAIRSSITIKISTEDKPLSDWIYVEAIDPSGRLRFLLRHVHGWAKANPDFVQQWKHERDGERVNA